MPKIRGFSQIKSNMKYWIFFFQENLWWNMFSASLITFWERDISVGPPKMVPWLLDCQSIFWLIMKSASSLVFLGEALHEAVLSEDHISLGIFPCWTTLLFVRAIAKRVMLFGVKGQWVQNTIIRQLSFILTCYEWKYSKWKMWHSCYAWFKCCIRCSGP